MIGNFVKRLFKTVTLAAAISAMSAWTVFAAQGVISFSDPQVSVGSEVNVSMKVTADEGTSLSNANIVLTYPSDGLEFVSGTDADGGAGAIRVHGTSNGGGTATLEYNLKFNTSKAGTFTIGIDSYEVYDGSDQPIDFTHLGNSTVTVSAGEDASSDCALASLDVYPGTLEPEFSADNTSYSVNVGLNVTKLTINAIAEDEGANVRISGNEDLADRENTVIVTVNAADGATSTDYTLTVNKVEGGPETLMPDGSNVDMVEGVQLSSKGKTITIMSPSEDVTIPEGFKQGTISIDDQKVQGWVWGASEDPEYCVVYGMNDKGEINFYRYDMVEKTIQRYFEDPLAAGSVSNAEYTAMEAERDEAVSSAETRLIIMVILAVIAIVFLMLFVYQSFRLKSSEQMQRAYKKQANTRFRRMREEAEEESEELIGRASVRNDTAGLENDGTEVSAAGDELLKHNYVNEPAADTSSATADETQVIRRPERRRRAGRAPLHEAAESMAMQGMDASDAMGTADNAAGAENAAAAENAAVVGNAAVEGNAVSAEGTAEDGGTAPENANAALPAADNNTSDI